MPTPKDDLLCHFTRQLKCHPGEPSAASVFISFAELWYKMAHLVILISLQHSCAFKTESKGKRPWWFWCPNVLPICFLKTGFQLSPNLAGWITVSLSCLELICFLSHWLAGLCWIRDKHNRFQLDGMDLNMMQNQAFRTGCVFTLFFFSWFSNYILIIVAHIICSIVTKSQQSGSTGPLSFSLWTKISLSAQKNSGHHQGNGELLARGHPSWYYPSFATSWDCSQSCCAWCLGILWVFANVIGPLTTSSHHTHTQHNNPPLKAFKYMFNIWEISFCSVRI